MAQVTTVPPINADVDGWHWIKRIDRPGEVIEPRKWIASEQSWLTRDGTGLEQPDMSDPRNPLPYYPGIHLGLVEANTHRMELYPLGSKRLTHLGIMLGGDEPSIFAEAARLAAMNIFSWARSRLQRAAQDELYEHTYGKQHPRHDKS